MNKGELKAEMARNYMTTRQLAQEIGMNENTLGRKINGKTSFALDEVLKICEILHINDDIRRTYIFLR